MDTEMTDSTGSKHVLHVKQGPEYAGETYIWCECRAGGQNLVQSGRRTDDVSLFEGGSLLDLLKFLAEHLPGEWIETVPVASRYVECSYPAQPGAKAASDWCRASAAYAVINDNGEYRYRCHEHRYRVDPGINAFNAVTEVPHRHYASSLAELATLLTDSSTNVTAR
jgi:hypothetical protein